MAKETAEITLSLVDELSPQLKAITEQFENLRRKIADTSERSNVGFRTVREEIDRSGHSLGGEARSGAARG